MNKHILLASAIIASSTLFAFAQGTSTRAASSSAKTIPTGTSTAKVILLAQIDLLNAKIQKAGLVNYDFSFTLKSFDLINQDAYYRVMLKDGDGKVVFLQSYPTKITVGAGMSVDAKDILVVPQDFKGKYGVFIQVTNDKGLPLAAASVGDIILAGGKSVMSIKGCDINGSSTITTSGSVSGNCEITGKTTANTSLYTTVYFGGMAAPSAQIKSKFINNKATFNIPPRSEPGTYQLVSQLYDAGTPRSSPVFNTFVVSGQSAKIITIKTDKGEYKKDEVAKLSVLLRTSNVMPGDIFATAKIATPDGSACGDLNAFPLKVGDAFTLEVPISQKCKLPAITVTITDKAGKVLDTLGTTVVTTGVKEKSIFGNITTIEVASGFVGAVAALIVLVALAVFIIRRRRGGIVTA